MTHAASYFYLGHCSLLLDSIFPYCSRVHNIVLTLELSWPPSPARITSLFSVLPPQLATNLFLIGVFDAAKVRWFSTDEEYAVVAAAAIVAHRCCCCCCCALLLLVLSLSFSAAAPAAVPAAPCCPQCCRGSRWMERETVDSASMLFWCCYKTFSIYPTFSHNLNDAVLSWCLHIWCFALVLLCWGVLHADGADVATPTAAAAASVAGAAAATAAAAAAAAAAAPAPAPLLLLPLMLLLLLPILLHLLQLITALILFCYALSDSLLYTNSWLMIFV